MLEPPSPVAPMTRRLPGRSIPQGTRAKARGGTRVRPRTSARRAADLSASSRRGRRETSGVASRRGTSATVRRSGRRSPPIRPRSGRLAAKRIGSKSDQSRIRQRKGRAPVRHARTREPERSVPPPHRRRTRDRPIVLDLPIDAHQRFRSGARTNPSVHAAADPRETNPAARTRRLRERHPVATPVPVYPERAPRRSPANKHERMLAVARANPRGWARANQRHAGSAKALEPWPRPAGRGDRAGAGGGRSGWR